MRYRLRTLLILIAMGPPLTAFAWFVIGGDLLMVLYLWAWFVLIVYWRWAHSDEPDRQTTTNSRW